MSSATIESLSPIYQDLFARRFRSRNSYARNATVGTRKCSGCHGYGHTIKKCCANVTINVLIGVCSYTDSYLKSYNQGEITQQVLESQLHDALFRSPMITVKVLAIFASFINCNITRLSPTSEQGKYRIIWTLKEMFRPVNIASSNPTSPPTVQPPPLQVTQVIPPQVIPPAISRVFPPAIPRVIPPAIPPAIPRVIPLVIPHYTPTPSFLVTHPTPPLVRLNSPHTPRESPPPLSPRNLPPPPRNSPPPLVMAPRSKIHIHFDGEIGESKNEHSCPICVCDDFDTHSMTTLQCSHRLCTDCFVGLFQADKTRHVNICPYCRAEINVVTVSSHESYYKIASMYLS
jgi:hypothetical protein